MGYTKISNQKISTKTIAGLTTGIPTATITGTTGSPTVDSATRAGKTIYKFTGSGSITVGRAGTCELLIIGGGGSGGGGNGSKGGGGGAGGLLYTTSAILPAGTLTVTIGAGGNRPGTLSQIGDNGMASRVGDYYAPGGGMGIMQATTGGSFNYRGGIAGGSGGGTGTGGGGPTVGGFGTPGLGNDGGANIGYDSTAGGGGAGAVGGNAINATTSGAGGAGRSISITGSAVTYAGGGGGGAGSSGGTGGAGGAGGGGAGGSVAAGTDATANTGGGGGGNGGGAGTYAGAGGSGYVVVVIG